MRVLGTIMLVLGVLFAVLFLIMAFSGDLNWGAFFIPVVLISLGARLRTSARGILQQNPSATPGAPSASADAAPSAATPTIELPMTPDAVAAITRYGARSRRLVL